jgi:hypothetical protein
MGVSQSSMILTIALGVEERFNAQTILASAT